MADPVSEELLRLNQRLLDSITHRDWAAYQDLCDPTLTAFEPEAVGQLVKGLDFHQFYFRPGAAPGDQQTTMASPQVRLMGDVAVVAYVRLNQLRGANGATFTASVAETRVWQRQQGQWKHVHFHRSSIRVGFDGRD
jgi:calcium/calmodulin-dependent protein kinase (CaM kinase) II